MHTRFHSEICTQQYIAATAIHLCSGRVIPILIRFPTIVPMTVCNTPNLIHTLQFHYQVTVLFTPKPLSSCSLSTGYLIFHYPAVFSKFAYTNTLPQQCIYIQVHYSCIDQPQLTSSYLFHLRIRVYQGPLQDGDQVTEIWSYPRGRHCHYRCQQAHQT